MSKQKKIKYKIVNMDAVIQLTSNDFYVTGADVTTDVWKRIAGALRGRLALVNASHLEGMTLDKSEVIVFNKALVNRDYIIERVFSRASQYHMDTASIVNRHIIEWMVGEQQLPTSFTVLYDHDLVHPRNTAGGSQKCTLLEKPEIRGLYKRSRVISDSQGQVKKEIWRLR